MNFIVSILLMGKIFKNCCTQLTNDHIRVYNFIGKSWVGLTLLSCSYAIFDTCIECFWLIYELDGKRRDLLSLEVFKWEITDFNWWKGLGNKTRWSFIGFCNLINLICPVNSPKFLKSSNKSYQEVKFNAHQSLVSKHRNFLNYEVNPLTHFNQKCVGVNRVLRSFFSRNLRI